MLRRAAAPAARSVRRRRAGAVCGRFTSATTIPSDSGSGGDVSNGDVAAPPHQPQQQQDFWPDGTPKQFSGADAWKNWIDWDSPHRALTDELNRARHFFFEVDAKGRLHRLELDHPGQRFGEVRDGRMLEHFFSHLAHNDTGDYEAEFPFLSRRMHERYFTRSSYAAVDESSAAQAATTATAATAATNNEEEDNRKTVANGRGVIGLPRVHGTGAPMVFNDFDAETGHLFRRLPEGQTPKSLRVPLQLSRLRVSPEGRLFHFFHSKGNGRAHGPRSNAEVAADDGSAAAATGAGASNNSKHGGGDNGSNVNGDNSVSGDVHELLALVDVSTAQRLFEELQVRVEEDDSDGWGGDAEARDGVGGAAGGGGRYRFWARVGDGSAGDLEQEIVQVDAAVAAGPHRPPA